MTEALLDRTAPARGADFLWADLAARVAHDLNNHLTSVLGKAEIGLMSPDPARWQRGLEEILEAGQQARALVADFQRLARWEIAGEGEVPAPDLLGVVVRLAGRRARRAGVRLEMTAHGCFPDPATAAHLALVLRYLVERALSLAEAPAEAGVAWRLEAVADPGGGWEVSLAHPGGPAILPGLPGAAAACAGGGDVPEDWAAVVAVCRRIGAVLVPGESSLSLRH